METAAKYLAGGTPSPDFEYDASTMTSERVERRIDRLLDRIDQTESEERWAEVRSLALDVLDLDPENDEASAYLRSAERRIADADAIESTDAVTSSQALADTPASFANGRYEVTGFLGEGDKKKVYLAHDKTLDRDVAFGLIKADGFDDAARQRITREAQAMGRLSDNPNIMPIFDLGEANGQPYMVGPLMRGVMSKPWSKTRKTAGCLLKKRCVSPWRLVAVWSSPTARESFIVI